MKEMHQEVEVEAETEIDLEEEVSVEVHLPTREAVLLLLTGIQKDKKLKNKRNLQTSKVKTNLQFFCFFNFY